MSKSTLYRKTVQGVTVVLTEEAHTAFLAIAAYYEEHRSYDLMDEYLWIEVALGTYTFCLDSRYATSVAARSVYTGGYGLLDEASRHFCFKPIQTDHSFSLPFASGDLDLFKEMAIKGWGPKTERFVDMFMSASAA
jgi:hypothetical protein